MSVLWEAGMTHLLVEFNTLADDILIPSLEPAAPRVW
jgi:hypothetical protein